MMTHSLRVFRALMFAALLAWSPGGVRAESIVAVATQAELEARIQEAREDDGLITFDCDGIIVLTNTIVLTNSVLIETNIDDGEITITTNDPTLIDEIVIDASGHFIAISGLNGTNTTNSVRLFSVGSGVTLTLTNVSFHDGVSTHGGAIFIDRGAQVVAVECVFSNNIALGSNGVSGANARTNTVTGKASDGHGGKSGFNAAGGAIYNLGIAQFDRCAFLTNGVFGGSGGTGGDGGHGTVTAGSGGAGGRGGLAYGGAIYNARELITTNCTFNFNFAAGGNGGDGGIAGTGPFTGLDGRGGAGGGSAGAAVFNDRNSASILVGSTFALNGATSGTSADAGSTRGTGRRGGDGPASAGGGLANYGTNQLVNCTFFANIATAGNGGAGGNGTVAGGRGGNGGTAWGGNVFNGGKGKKSHSEMIALNCTFSDGGAVPGTNGPAGTGPFAGKAGSRGVSRGSNLANSNGIVYLTNCVIAYPNPGTNIFGKLTNPNFNLLSDRSVKFKPARSNLFNLDPKLDILRRNGGFVETIELLEGSPAIDAGDTNVHLSTDARGVGRPVGGRTDIGAYESGVYLGAPRITVQPVSQLVREDGSVTFTVVAQGDAPLLYQWQKGTGDSGDPIDGATESSHTVFPATDDDEGSYEVVISNNSGSVRSSTATLTIVHPPSITEDPEDTVVDRGENFFLSVTAEGDAPLTYQWFTNDVRVPGAELSTYTVLDAKPKDAVTYHVRVCNTYGCVDSAPARVTVVTNSLPSITIQPVNRIVAITNNTSFSVVADGARPLAYQWFTNGVAQLTATNPTLNIVNAQLANAGTYRVRVSNALGFIDSTNVPLVVQNQKPTIVTEPVAVATIASQNVSFTVGAGGSAPFTYQWYFNTNTALAGRTNATLTLTNVQTANIGSYHVIVANTLGTATSAPVALTIAAAQPTITAQPVSTSVFTGDTASFTVTATGSNPLRYQWYFNNTPLLTAVSPTLTIVNAQATNAGTYHVVVTNALGGATSGPVTLTVSDSAPVITVPLVPVSAEEDTPVTMKVSVLGSKPLLYQWFFNDAPLFNPTNVTLTVTNLASGSLLQVTNNLEGSSIFIESANRNDEGIYRVMMMNSFGSQQDDTALDILGFGQ